MAYQPRDRVDSVSAEGWRQSQLFSLRIQCGLDYGVASARRIDNDLSISLFWPSGRWSEVYLSQNEVCSVVWPNYPNDVFPRTSLDVAYSDSTLEAKWYRVRERNQIENVLTERIALKFKVVGNVVFLTEAPVLSWLAARTALNSFNDSLGRSEALCRVGFPSCAKLLASLGIFSAAEEPSRDWSLLQAWDEVMKAFSREGFDLAGVRINDPSAALASLVKSLEDKLFPIGTQVPFNATLAGLFNLESIEVMNARSQWVQYGPQPPAGDFLRMRRT